MQIELFRRKELFNQFVGEYVLDLKNVLRWKWLREKIWNFLMKQEALTQVYQTEVKEPVFKFELEEVLTENNFHQRVDGFCARNGKMPEVILLGMKQAEELQRDLAISIPAQELRMSFSVRNTRFDFRGFTVIILPHMQGVECMLWENFSGHVKQTVRSREMDRNFFCADELVHRNIPDTEFPNNFRKWANELEERNNKRGF